MPPCPVVSTPLNSSICFSDISIFLQGNIGGLFRRLLAAWAKGEHNDADEECRHCQEAPAVGEVSHCSVGFHEKGAFTGALLQRAGRFELANGGTLLLDEIGDVSPQFQAKLLRVLQEGEFERLGGTKTLKVDVRVICATNKDLEVAVLRGEFRADLYYRINVVPIILPPLRQREGDISLLAQVFLEQFNKSNDRNFDFAPSAIGILSKCAFPGNVRELDNCVQRTATLASSNTIASSDFACQQDQCSSALLWKDAPDDYPVHSLNPRDTMLGGLGANAGTPSGSAATIEAPGLTERDRLIKAMVKAGWVQAKAARILGKTPRQVGYALRRFGIDVIKE